MSRFQRNSRKLGRIGFCRSRSATRPPRRVRAFETLEPRLALSVAPGLVDVGTQPTGTLSGKIVFTSAGHGWKGSGTSYTTDRPEYWRTSPSNPADDGEIVEDFGNQDQMTFYADYLLRAGATVVPMRPVGRQTTEIVLDNDSAGVTYTGSWNDSTDSGVAPRYYDEDYGIGADSVRYRNAATTTGPETSVATYTPNIPAAGFYPVYTWVARGTNRTTQLYRINHTGGCTEIRVDHSKVGLGWVYLGTYHFASGSSTTLGSVQISNNGPAGKVVIADAIRFGNGMGDWIEPGATVVSGKPREDENSEHWINRMLGQGTSAAEAGITDNVNAPSNMAEWMLAGTYNPAGGVVDAVYIGFHSNGTTGDPSTANGRGAKGLYDTDVADRTPHQTGTNGLADILGAQINQDFQNLNGVFEVNWATGVSSTFSGNYGELNLGAGAEMDATIIEVAFHDNVQDNLLLRDPKARDLIARSVYQGTLQYFAAWGGATNTSLPTAPTNVSAVSNASGAVSISWAAGPTSPAGVYGAAATGFRVYASVDGYGFDGGTYVAGSAATSVTLTGYDPTRSYYFKVVAENAGGQSLASEVVTALPTGGVKQVLIVNGFDRFDRTQNFRYPYAGGDSEGRADRVWSRYNNSFDYVVQVQSAIQAAKPGVHVASTSNEAVISGAVNLADYDAVIWILGNESSGSTSSPGATSKRTFDTAEQTLVTNYVNAGGNLFLSGAEIGWDLDQQNNGRTFYETVLKGNYVNDDAGTYNVAADAGGIFAGMANFGFSTGSSFSSLDGQLYNVAYPDVIAPQAGAVSALSYSGGLGGSAAIQSQGTGGAGDIVMFGFPFETITNANSRQIALGRILDFFNIVPPNADFNSDNTVDASDYVVWRKNNGVTSGASHADGDADRNGAVDAWDYDVWRLQFGTTPAVGGGTNVGSAATVDDSQPALQTRSAAVSSPADASIKYSVVDAAIDVIAGSVLKRHTSTRTLQQRQQVLQERNWDGMLEILADARVSRTGRDESASSASKTHSQRVSSARPVDDCKTAHSILESLNSPLNSSEKNCDIET